MSLALTACHPGQGSGGSGGPAVSGAPQSKLSPEIPVSWQSDKTAVRITAVRSAASSIQVDLLLPAGAPMPTAPAVFNFCLPRNEPYKLKIRRYALGGRVIHALDARDQPSVTSSALALDPAQSLSLQPAGVLRDCAIGHLSLHESFWTPWQQARPAADLTATVEILWQPASNAPATSAAAAPANPESVRGMALVQRHFVANPQDVGRWPVKNPPLAQDLSTKLTDPRPLAPQGASWFRLRIERDGLYRLSARDLAQAGLPAPDALARVRLFSLGKPVPVYRVKAGGEDAVLFYGWQSRTPYDSKQVYWLTLADQPAAPAADPALMKGTTQDLATLHKTARCRRENVLKISHAEFMRIVDATWVDCELIADKPVSIPLALDHPVPLAGNARLKGVVKFYPEGNPALWMGTEAELSHNGQVLAQFKFSPDDPSFDRPVTLPASVFDAAGRTTLTLAVSKATTATLPAADNKEGIWFIGADVAYEGVPSLENGRLVLDEATATTSTSGTLWRVALGAPVIPAGTDLLAFAVNGKTCDARPLPIEQNRLTFPVRGGWHAEAYDPRAASAPALEPVSFQDDPLQDTGADEVIVTHAMFLDTVKPLAELHQHRGLKTRIVDVQRLYDLFSDGMTSPLAIRAWLGYAATHWRALPQDLLLFGDCTEDYRGRYRSPTGLNFVPSYTYVLGEEQWPSDYWFSLVAGADTLPDLMVSRISVNNLDDAKAVVDKTIRYASEPMLGPWRTKMAFVADNMQGYHKMAETARQELTPEAIEAPRIYLDELPLNDNWYVAPNRIDNAPVEDTESLRKVSGAATNQLKDLLNSGVPLLEYFGHGSPNLWCHERVWFGGGSPNRDTQYLKAGGRYSFIINYACATGKIDYPVEPWNVCISEDFLRTPDGGAIGLFVPSGFGTQVLQDVLMRYWHVALFCDKLRGMGELTTLVRARLGADQANESHLFMYELLGDPMLDLQRADQWRELELTPSALKPGAAQVQAALGGIEPAAGKARLWLETEHGETLWEGAPFDYSGGQIRQTVALPAGLKSPQRLRVALYAWNDQEKRDLLAGGSVTIERPAVLIRSARAMRAGEGKVKFELDLENTGRIASGDLNLAIQPAPGGGGSNPLAGQTITALAGGESRHVELTAPQAGSQKGVACFEAVLTTPDPPDDLTQSYPLRYRFALAPDPAWIGWAPALGRWQDNGGAHIAHIELCAISAAAPPAGLCAVWHTATGNQVTTLPLAFRPRDGVYLSTATVPLTVEIKPAAGGDTVDLLQPVPGAAPRVLGRMTLGELPRVAPRLRIRPESIRYTPARPVDGETIFVTFSLENTGNAASVPCQPALYDKPRSEGGKPLGFRSEFPKTNLPALGAGRVTTETLRWDPIDNAGMQSIVVDVDPVPNRTAAEVNDQSAPLRLYVLSKSRLARGRLLPPARLAPGRFKLTTEVVNEGETDAHNVEVTYYRTPEKKPEEKLGTVPLERIPALGSVQAALVCNLNEATDKPVVEIRLKGSAQVITK